MPVLVHLTRLGYTYFGKLSEEIVTVIDGVYYGSFYNFEYERDDNILYYRFLPRDRKKKDLQRVAGISNPTIAKLGKNEVVRTDVLEKICRAIECDISDIMEMTGDRKR